MKAIGNKRSVFAALGVAAALFAFGTPADAGSIIYGAKDGPAVQGYDVVNYFTDGAPKEGDPKFAYEWNGASWQFASADHLAKFKADPAHYAPQYGAYCAYAMANGDFAKGDANRWRIVDDKLYLNANIIAQKLWTRDVPGKIQKADGEWPSHREELVNKP